MLNDMQGQSPMLALSGAGTLNLAEQTCDTQFDIRVVGGWNGESKLIDFLKETPVPLRVYGNWQQLNYSLQVDQLLRKHLQDGEDVGYQVTCPVGLIRRVKRRIRRSRRHHYILNM